jgi:hypothetical protein
MAWKIYSEGIHVARSEGLADNPKFRKMVALRTSLHRRFTRADFMQLPPELIVHIFSHFDIHELR